MNLPLIAFDTTKDLTELSSEWPKWKRAFEFYIAAKAIKNPNQKYAHLMHAGGIGLQEIYVNLPEIEVEKQTTQSDEDSEEEHDSEEPDEYTKAIKKLDNHFCVKRNVTVERYKFRSIRQMSEEGIEQFVVRLRTQLNRCDYGPLSDEHMRDQIIEGTTSDKLREKALLKNKITLSELLKLGQALEATKLNLKNLSRGKQVDSEINHLVNNGSRKRNNSYEQSQRTFGSSNNSHQNKKPRYENSNANNKRKCFRCGKEGHMSFDRNCPAKNRVCERCSKMGHFKQMCRTKLSQFDTNNNEGKPIPVRQIEEKNQLPSEVYYEESKIKNDDEYLFHIGSLNESSIKYKFNIGNVPLEMLIDSGSEVNVIDMKTWENLKKKKITIIDSKKGSNKNLRGYGSQAFLSIVGEFTAKIRASQSEVEAKFYVVKEAGQALLGRITSMQLGILKIGDINSIKNVNAVGKIKDVLVDIPIDETITPVSQAYRRVPIPLENKVHEKIEDLLEQVSWKLCLFLNYVYLCKCY